MLTPFFSGQPVGDYTAARASDTRRYAAFFHSMLDQGVSAPPSAFETWFLSAAHGDVEIARTLAAAEEALGAIV
jgi:glutamate-1-semialdehyde 2,1-aminomutase